MQFVTITLDIFITFDFTRDQRTRSSCNRKNEIASEITLTYYFLYK